jgi:hypothetical protein
MTTQHVTSEWDPRVLCGYGLSWLDVHPTLSELRLEFIASPEEARYHLHLFGVTALAFSAEPGDQAPYTVVHASITPVAAAPDPDARQVRLHVEGEVTIDVTCRDCVVYVEWRR